MDEDTDNMGILYASISSFKESRLKMVVIQALVIVHYVSKTLFLRLQYLTCSSGGIL